MAKVNLKNVHCKRSDQENEEDGPDGSKKEQRVIQRDSSPKRGQISQETKGKETALHILFFAISFST